MEKWKVKALIYSKGYTQKSFAEAVGVSPMCISSIVCGRRMPSVKLLGRMAKALGMSLPELVKELELQREG